MSDAQLRCYKYMFSVWPTVSIIKSSDGLTCVTKKGLVLTKRKLSEVHKYG